MKVLYIFSGRRKDKIKLIESRSLPDTQLYGLNHLDSFNITAQSSEISSKYLSFRLKHFLSFFLIRQADIVFGASLLYSMVLQKIFKKKTKFVLLNISLNRTLIKKKSSTLISLAKNFDLIVCPSNYQRTQLIKQFNFSPNQVVFIPLGVDIEFYKPNFQQRQDYILSVGRDNGRDYKTIVDVAQKMPQQKFVFICSQRNLENIDQLSPNIEVLYDIPAMELYKHYLKAKLLLLITHPDGYLHGSDCSGQTVLLDAFASGLPVIATNRAWLSDYATDQQSIILVESYQATQLMEQIKVLADPDFRESLAQRAYQQVKDNFSTIKMAENLAQIFKNLLKT